MRSIVFKSFGLWGVDWVVGLRKELWVCRADSKVCNIAIATASQQEELGKSMPSLGLILSVLKG